MIPLRKTVQKTVHASICFEVASQLVTGTTFCLPSRVPVSVKEVEVLSPNTASHHRVRRVALDPA